MPTEVIRPAVSSEISRKNALYFAFLGLAFFVAGSVGLDFTVQPVLDEAWDADPGYHLYKDGRLYSAVVEPAAHLGDACQDLGCLMFSKKPAHLRTSFVGADRHVYWHMPLHLVFQAGWYHLVGFGLVRLRLISAFWGLVLLGSLYYVVRALSDSPGLAALAVGLTSCDFVFVSISSFGRMEMMCLALGVSSWAAYLYLRQRSLYQAVLAASSLLVAAVLTHPNALMACVGCLFLCLYFDRRNLCWGHAAAAILPATIGLSVWGLYILEDPKLFTIQFFGNAAGRGESLLNWIGAIHNEALRHISIYGWGPSDTRSASTKAVVLAKATVITAYLASVFGAWTIPELRRTRGTRALLILVAIGLFMLVFFDRIKLPFYLINAIPFYTVSLALVIWWIWRNQPKLRRWLTVGLATVAAINGAVVINRIHRDLYHRSYLPAVAFLKEHAGSGSLIMGPSDLGFDLGFQKNLNDDLFRFGYYSCKTADFITTPKDFEDVLADRNPYEPEIVAYVRRLLTTYHNVFQNELYTVYAKGPDGTAVMGPGCKTN